MQFFNLFRFSPWFIIFVCFFILICFLHFLCFFVLPGTLDFQCLVILILWFWSILFKSCSDLNFDRYWQISKKHWQISKKRCFEKNCSCDQACQFSASLGTTWRSYLENLTIDDKFINKRVRIFIYQTVERKKSRRKTY